METHARNGQALIRLMIADDHTILRESLKHLFALADDIEVSAEAMNGSEVLERLRQKESGQLDIDMLLLDMNMPGISGEDLILRLRAQHPTLPILVLSMHNQAQVAQRALKAGASGYLSKDRDAEMLLAAIRKVTAGGRFIDPVLAEQMAFESSGIVSSPHHACLSDREFEILCLCAKGVSLNDIAAKFSISNKTVSTHKSRLMEKMGFASNAELVRYALAHGLVS
jgi:DNA-binding NarL/FixJ family response regulator